VFDDLAAACDYSTLWHRGLNCKLLQLLPGRRMVRMIMEMVPIAASPLPQETVNGAGCGASRTVSTVIYPAPILFNIYIFDLLTTVSIIQQT